MPQDIHTHTLANGLTLLAERMPHVRSAAFNVLVPAGAAHDPPGKHGLAGLVCDLMTRGAGSRDSRQLSDAMDNLGLDRGESSGTLNVQLSGATLSRNLLPTLELYADVLRRPHLPEDELDAAKSLSLQDIQSVEDEPQRKVMIELRKRYYPDPLGRDNRGTEEGVNAATIEDVRTQHARLYQPRDVILAVAGDIDWPALKGKVEELFGDRKPGPRPAIDPKPITPQSGHVAKDLDQTQIALAYPSVPIGHADFYAARGMVGVLSQDMSSRLFTNVREKHGLCYSVYASYETFKDRASIVGYAGARPELAQETLDRTLAEFRDLVNGIEEEELDRVKVGLKSALIMRQESTGARAGAMASDWYFLGRVRPLEEVQAAVNGLTVPMILDYARRYPAKDVTVVTLGPAANGRHMTFHHHTLSNGLTILGETNPAALSVAVALWVKTGSRDESPEVSGVSHFLEHMVFKGTPRRDAVTVNKDFSRIGADNNAWTSEENTVFHAVVLPEFLPEVVDVLGDILRPSLRGEDFDTEKKVILDEIVRYEVQPGWAVYDHARKQFYNGHPLGNSVLGTTASITALTRDQMAAYYKRRYVAPNIVAVAAGNFDWPRFVSLIEKATADWPTGDAPRTNRTEPPGAGGVHVIPKPADKVAQQYVTLIAPAAPADHELGYAGALVATIMGDYTGSRLFWALTDPGLADEAGMGIDECDGAGAYYTSFNCPPERAAECFGIVRGLLEDVQKNGVSDDEFRQAKTKVLSREVRAGERTQRRMLTVAKDWVYRGEYRSVDDELAAWDAVTLKDIRAVLDRYPLTNQTVTAYGPLEKLG